MVDRDADVRLATAEDVASWLDLAGEVEPLFGPMPDLAAHLQRGIARATAYVISDKVQSVPSVRAGILLSGPVTRPAAIRWLAVRAPCRRMGLGGRLVDEAVHHFGQHSEVVVETFGTDHPAGAAAQGLYLSRGFVAEDQLPRGADGGSRQRFRRMPPVGTLLTHDWAV